MACRGQAIPVHFPGGWAGRRAPGTTV